MPVELTKFDYLDPKLAADKLAAAVNTGGGGGGMALLASGKITTPVAYFDVALPSGYDQFRLAFSGIFATDSICFVLSKDGGTTFWNDAVNSDTYASIEVTYAAGGTVQSFTSSDGLIDFGARALNDGEVIILPGDNANPPRALFAQAARLNHWVIGQAVVMGTSNLMFTLNPQAIVAPALARANLMRWLPYGNDDCNPPTSGETITAGSWTLFGIPTPT